MTDISVAMATFNGAAHIEAQLRSLLAQTTPPAEIVICDDGSTDDTLEVVRGVARTTSIPIRVHSNDSRLGFADNFLKAARLSTSAFVAFCDQDDLWEPEKLSRCMSEMRLHDAQLCTHQVRHMSVTGDVLRLDTQGITRTRALRAGQADPFGVFFGFTMTVDRRLLDLLPASSRGVDTFSGTGVLPHDRWAYFLATTFGTVVTVAEPLALYRQHPSQTFGAESLTLWGRMAKKWREGPERLEFFRATASDRAELVRSTATPLPTGWTDPGRASARWARIADFYHHRHAVWVDRRFTRRASALRASWRAGTYHSLEKHGLGKKRLLEDVVLGLMGPVFMRGGRGSTP